jgi:hypothetical protein
MSNGKRTGTGNVKNGKAYLAWASMDGSSPAIFSDPSENAGISLFHVL